MFTEIVDCTAVEETFPITFQNWLDWRAGYGALPVVAGYPATSFVPDWSPWWRKSTHSLLLETGKAGRYTILVPRIETLLEGTENGLRELNAGSGETLQVYPGNPLVELKTWMARRRAPSCPRLPFFCGGLVGLFSYDFARVLEVLPSHSRADIDFPLYLFGLAEEGLVYDRAESTLYCFCLHTAGDKGDAALEAAFRRKSERVRRLKDEWSAALAESRTTPACHNIPNTNRSPSPPLASSFSRDEFVGAVRRIQEYIAAGDSYQVNLSVRQSRPLRATPESVYEHLRRINPSPYMALLRFPGSTLVCGSPELLIRLRAGRLEARPIAGTRPRGETSDEDTSLTREMLLSEKERAEHLMLVDLIRNDIGRVSRFGTVGVSEFMTVESYSHVMHIVSHIEGELAGGKEGLDAVAAAFPGGTVTGAPKVRTMEIIEEIEPCRRGPYTGSIGWLAFDGNLELNIIIRTMLVKDGIAHVQAGAGIVADSIPEKEYEESLNKAKALWAAAARAEQSDG